MKKTGQTESKKKEIRKRYEKDRKQLNRQKREKENKKKI